MSIYEIHNMVVKSFRFDLTMDRNYEIHTHSIHIFTDRWERYIISILGGGSAWQMNITMTANR